VRKRCGRSCPSRQGYSKARLRRGRRINLNLRSPCSPGAGHHSPRSIWGEMESPEEQVEQAFEDALRALDGDDR
jgi:hypothetical protein